MSNTYLNSHGSTITFVRFYSLLYSTFDSNIFQIVKVLLISISYEHIPNNIIFSSCEILLYKVHITQNSHTFWSIKLCAVIDICQITCLVQRHCDDKLRTVS